MFDCFGKIPDHKWSISPLNYDVQLPKFVVTPVSPIDLSEWVVISPLLMVRWASDAVVTRNVCCEKSVDLKSVQGMALNNVTRIKKSIGVIELT